MTSRKTTDVFFRIPSPTTQHNSHTASESDGSSTFVDRIDDDLDTTHKLGLRRRTP
jgi:hypothetical protein